MLTRSLSVVLCVATLAVASGCVVAPPREAREVREVRSYQEGISGTDCPLTGVGKYAPKHNPMIFFDDVTDSGMTTSQHCIKHVRPYPELAADLTSDKIANYNFITPDLCNDMHGDDPNCGMKYDGIKAGDTWLASEVPKLLASKAYMNGATVIITWDEGELSDGPIGMIMLGKSVKVGFSSPTAFDHSSMVRTMQDIFGLKPYLGGAATATNLSELFTKLP